MSINLDLDIKPLREDERRAVMRDAASSVIVKDSGVNDADIVRSACRYLAEELEFVITDALTVTAQTYPAIAGEPPHPAKDRQGYDDWKHGLFMEAAGEIEAIRDMIGVDDLFELFGNPMEFLAAPNRAAERIAKTAVNAIKPASLAMYGGFVHNTLGIAPDFVAQFNAEMGATGAPAQQETPTMTQLSMAEMEEENELAEALGEPLPWPNIHAFEATDDTATVPAPSAPAAPAAPTTRKTAAAAPSGESKTAAGVAEDIWQHYYQARGYDQQTEAKAQGVSAATVSNYSRNGGKKITDSQAAYLRESIPGHIASLQRVLDLLG